jgi:DNA-binding MarR family transcriptional regulator
VPETLAYASTRPLTREQRFLLTVVQAADALKRYYAAVIEPFGLSLAQFNVLRILMRAGPDGLPTLTIRDRMVERAPAITRLLDHLVARGWVERQRDAHDRRVVHCRLTDEGIELLDVLGPVIDEANDGALGSLDPDSQSVVVDALARVIAVVDPEATPAG